MYSVPVAAQRRLDGQFLHIDIGAVERRQLCGQRANIRTLHAVPIDQTRHFDTCALRQIGDQPRIRHIAVDAGGRQVSSASMIYAPYSDVR